MIFFKKIYETILENNETFIDFKFIFNGYGCFA